jgi:hypothetical protein
MAMLGFTPKEIHKREYKRLQDEVKSLYKENYQLHARFTPINSVPLELRLGRSAKQLKQWLHKIHHQIRMTQTLDEFEQSKQLTIRQAFQQAGHTQ